MSSCKQTIPVSFESSFLFGICFGTVDASILGPLVGLRGNEFSSFFLHHVFQSLELFDIQSLKTDQFLPSD